MHCIIGFWCINKRNFNQCYLQFRVENPLLTKVKQGNLEGEEIKKQILFHISGNNDMFYFTKEKDGNIAFNEVDLDRAMTGTDLEVLQPNLNKLPTKSSIKFSGAASHLLLSFFSTNPTEKPAPKLFSNKLFVSANLAFKT
jgi:hypothetical protein